MPETTFIFLCIATGMLSIFALAAMILELYINHQATKYHLTQQNKVLTLQSTMTKGK